jgi:rubrerythrin/DNA-directed RNA polymerase subunit RPC12/RpoP
MNFYRCQICGDVYMGRTKPSNCPYCGAKNTYMSDAKDWTDENETITSLTDISRENLSKALQLEVNNAPFYRDGSAKAKTMELQGIFKGLAKVEAEHASLIRKILKCEMPEPERGREQASGTDIENLRLAHSREVFATDFYKNAAAKAVEPRIKKVFTALSEIETDHINIEDALLNGGH